MSDSDFEDEATESNVTPSISVPSHYIELDKPELFIDRFSIIHGGSMSGKTTAVRYILGEIRKYVPNIIAVTPDSSRPFYAEFLPPTSIFETISEQDINNIVDRQEGFKKIRDVTEKIEVLHLIHSIIAPSKAELFLEEMRRRGLDEVECVKMLRIRLGSGKPEFQEMVKRALMTKMIAMETAGDAAREREGKGLAAALAAIKVIGVDPGEFGPADFRKERKERFSVYKALGILEKSLKDNPPLEVLKIIYNAYCFFDACTKFALILDDMSPSLPSITNYKILEKEPFSGDPKVKKKVVKESEKKKIFEEIATRCRHVGLTCIIITHMWKNIAPKIRLRANVYLFTNKEAFEEAIKEISHEDAAADKQYSIAKKIYEKTDENGGAFYKAVYSTLDTTVNEKNQSRKLKMLKAEVASIPPVETTKRIDDFISRHGDGSGPGYSF